MTLKEWQYAFTNGMNLEDQRGSYERYLIPESRRIIRGFLTQTAKVDFSKKREPLLFVSGCNDHMMPANLNFLNYSKYKNSDSITNYKEFEDVNHYLLGGGKWHEIADYIINWIKQHGEQQGV